MTHNPKPNAQDSGRAVRAWMIAIGAILAPMVALIGVLLSAPHNS